MKVKSWMMATTVAGAMGLSGVILTPTVAQVIAQVSTQDQKALAEAERLNQQIIELYKQGKYNEAIPLAEQALAITKQQLGDNHPDTASSLNNLALLYGVQARYSEAEPLYKQALTIIKQQLGDNHPLTASSLDNLASLYDSQDDIPQAINYLSQGLAVEEDNLSENLKMGDDKQKQDYRKFGLKPRPLRTALSYNGKSDNQAKN